VRIGYKLSTEGFAPQEIVRQARAAESVGFDFIEISDHFHPWLESQGHSGNTWVMLGAIAASTDRIGLVTGVTCPSYRYHPAVVAQAAATLQIVSDGRFTLGVGAGERLNEHVVGSFPGVHERHEAFREALEIIRLLWKGGYCSYRGRHLSIDDARVFDLPDRLPDVCVAVSGPGSLAVANDVADGLFAIEPKAELVEGFTGAGPRFGEVPLAWAPDVDQAVDAVLEKSGFLLTGGWPVLAELPNVASFEAVSAGVTADQARAAFACGPSVERHVEVAAAYVDAGFDHLVLQNAGPDPDGFLKFFQTTLHDRLRGLDTGGDR